MRPWEKYATPWQKYRTSAIRSGIEAATVIQLARKKSQQLGGSGDNEYFTPPKYVEAVRDVLGTIDLDPASCDEAQANVRAKTYFTKEDDGLQREWHGRVFLNPPFSRPLLRPFVQKLIHEYKSGRVTEAILLGFSNTSTRVFQEVMGVASGFCFTNTNIAFIHRDKGQMGRSAIGQVFLYFGNNRENFFRRFAEFGELAVPRKMKNSELTPQQMTAQIIVLREHRLMGGISGG